MCYRLKYLYLLFKNEDLVPLDKWVFNTEAHPFVAPAAKSVYGSGKTEASAQPFKVKTGPLPAVSFAPKLPVKEPN